MGKIHILNAEISNKIAAGEVVERPLSIVKELVENSIDAGADVITVEIKDGGIEFIRVTDNGSGMTEDDAKICFLRHATSKIATDEDLDAIYTLGFRGEALSSIGAVAKVKLYTKKKDSNMGVLVTCEGGEILSSTDAGMSDGTVLEVRDLFYNTPARKKFLKKPATEGGYISDLMGRYVFSYPEISFKLIRDGKEVIFSAGDNNIFNSVYSIYGKDYAKNMLEVDYDYNGIRVVGLIGKGTLCRPNRNYESLFVNRRYIKSPTMIRAIEEAYKNQIMVSKFPTVILNLEIPAELVDINVHPTKLECKFSNEQDIYQAVYHAVKSTLYALPNVPQMENSLRISGPENREKAEQKSIEELFSEKLHESQLRKQELDKKPIQKPAEITKPIKEPQREIFAVQPDDNARPINDKDYKFDAFSMLDFAVEHSKRYDNTLKVKSPEAQTKNEDVDEEWLTYLINVKNANPNKENPFAGEYFRVIGQVFETYILVEKGENLLMIDQHAAHERLNYEALKKELENTGIMQQMILEPIEIKLHPNEYEVYTENKDEFGKLGFECQANGDIITVTAIPGDISWSDGEPLFLELLSQMSDMKNSIISEKKERLLYTISCKASIKANMKISQREMETLVSKVFALENINTCPHGRPIVISLSKNQIEKDFKRIT